MKVPSIILAALVASAAPVSAQTFEDLNAGLAAFTDNALPALPMAASAGLDWSNAYVGPLLGGDFPYIHGGAGVSLGITTIPGKAVDKLFSATGGDSVAVLPLPYAVANLRLGGIILPFDFGLKAGFLPEEYATKVADGYTFSYQNLGFDVRYDLMKGNFWLPDISAGGGLHYLEIGVAKSVGSSQTYTDQQGAYLQLGSPRLNLLLRTTVIEAKAQISKTIFFLITPYAGLSALLGSGSAESGLKADVVSNRAFSYWDQYNVHVQTDGFQHHVDSATFGVKVYGGASLNVLILKLDLQGMYNLTDGSGGGQLGVRLEL